jgi:hypothetical protein
LAKVAITLHACPVALGDQANEHVTLDVTGE